MSAGTQGTAGTKETVADVVANARKIADGIEKETDWEHDLFVVDNSLVDAFGNLLDRFEAAWKLLRQGRGEGRDSRDGEAARGLT